MIICNKMRLISNKIVEKWRRILEREYYSVPTRLDFNHKLPYEFKLFLKHLTRTSLLLRAKYY